MTKDEISYTIRGILGQDLEDDDAWHLAMTLIRDLAWEGKELIHKKRLAEHEANRAPRVGKSRSGLAPEELATLMKDLGL
jgi:hypothetical protein